MFQINNNLVILKSSKQLSDLISKWASNDVFNTTFFLQACDLGTPQADFS